MREGDVGADDREHGEPGGVGPGERLLEALHAVGDEEDEDAGGGGEDEVDGVRDPEHGAGQEQVAERAAADGGDEGEEDEAGDVEAALGGGEGAADGEDGGAGVVGELEEGGHWGVWSCGRRGVRRNRRKRVVRRSRSRRGILVEGGGGSPRTLSCGGGRESPEYRDFRANLGGTAEYTSAVLRSAQTVLPSLVPARYSEIAGPSAIPSCNVPSNLDALSEEHRQGQDN